MFIVRFIGKLMAVLFLIVAISAVVQKNYIGAVVGFAFFLACWLGSRKRSSKDWRTDPASDKQKSFAKELGIKVPKGISKGDLSDLISAEVDT